MGDSFSAVPSAIARLGEQFAGQAQELGQAAESFGGSALEVADAFGLLGACDGAMEKYLKMAHSTVRGLEQLSALWDGTGNQLILQAEQYAVTEAESTGQPNGIPQSGASGGGN